MTYYANCVILNVFISPGRQLVQFVAAQAMNSNRGMKGSILLQDEADSRAFKGEIR